MTGLVIRPMKQADIPALCRADGCETPAGLECFERYFAWQQEGECVFLLAFLNGALTGLVCVFSRCAC